MTDKSTKPTARGVAHLKVTIRTSPNPIRVPENDKVWDDLRGVEYVIDVVPGLNQATITIAKGRVPHGVLYENDLTDKMQAAMRRHHSTHRSPITGPIMVGFQELGR